jgi:acyl carrier protein
MKMNSHDLKQLEQDIKELIVERLDLEDISPDEIDSDMSLFGGGLGLSSVNALELDTALQKRFGEDSARAEHGVAGKRLGTIDLFRYSTVRLLAEYIDKTLSSSDVAIPQPNQDFGARRRAALELKNSIRD